MGTMGDFTIRDITKEDLDEVTRIHCASFPDRTLIKLGEEAVRRYYAFLLEDFPQAKPICASTAENTLAGFCFAGAYSGSFSEYIRQNFGFLVGRAIVRPWLIFSPLIWELIKPVMKVIKWMLGRRREVKTAPVSQPQSQGTFDKTGWGILAIAVDPQYQRKGVGEHLMTAVEDFARPMGIENLDLSVHPDNLSAILFYEKLGWEKNANSGEWNGKMAKRLV